MSHLRRWVSSLTSRLARHSRIWKGGGAVAAASVVSFWFIFSGTDVDRTARAAQARQAVIQQQATAPTMADAGVLPFGRAFLQASDQEGDSGNALTSRDPTTSIDWFLIQDIDQALDPARGGDNPGGLYPLRKAMEQLAGILIIPLILISVLHALVTKKGGADQHLVKVGIQFFTVIFMLWAYPYWDAALYRGLAMPLTETLTKGEVVTDVVRGIGNVAAESSVDAAENQVGGDATDTYASIGSDENWRKHGTSPMQEIAAFYQNSQACQMEISTAVGGGNPAGGSVADACFGEDVPLSRQLMHGNDVQAYVGDADASEVEMTEDDFQWYNPGDWWDGAKEKVATLRNLPNAMADTFTGWMIQLIHWIGVLVVWFVWIAIIVARAFSLCLAPIAIVWGLVPGGENKPKKWFKGHASIVFKPVAIALGLLVFYGMMMAVLAMDFGTGAGGFIIGAGVKLALVLAMIAILWKSSTLTSIASGDVTEVAADFGNSFRAKGVQIAGTAAVVAGSTAGAGAGAAASLGGNVAAKAAGTKLGGKAAGKLAQVGMAGNSLLDKFGVGKSTGVSRFDQVVGGTKRVARETGRVARNVWENRTTEEDTQSVGGVFRSGVVNPMKEFAHEMERMRDGSSSGSGAGLGQNQVTRLEQAIESREARREHREELGMDEPKVIDGETIEIHSDAVQVQAGDSNRDFRFGNDIARSVLELAAGEELTLDVSVDDDENISLGAETLKGLLSAMEADDGLRKLFEREARHHFGNDFPTVAGQERDLPDVQALLEESTALASGLEAAADGLEKFEQELHRRSLVAHLSNAREGSAFERAVRELDPDRLAHRLDDESDEEYADRLRIWTNKALHAADLISGGTPADEAVRSAVHAGWGESEGVVRTRGWDTRDSLSDMSDAERQALRTALTEMKGHADSVSRRMKVSVESQTYGLDTDHYLATGYRRFEGMPGSVYEQVAEDKPDDADPRDIYQDAREMARNHDALPSRDEVDTATFERRLNEIVFLDEAALRERGRLDD